MASTRQLPIAIASKAILVLTCAAALAACGRGQGAPTSASVGGAIASAPKVLPGVLDGGTPETAAPASANADAAEGPVTLPPITSAPATATDPGSMTVHATAETVTMNVAPGIGSVTLAVIRGLVTWSPVKGAVSYNVYQLASKDGQAEGAKGTKVYSKISWIKTAICGGGYGLGNLAVGQEYVYTVEAIDRAGNIIGKGQDNCAPLQPLSIPYLKEPGQNAAHVGQTPYFSWTTSNGANGYYVEAFSTLGGSIPALPMWRAYREGSDAMTIQYGVQADVMTGSKPMQWALPLNVGSRYAWTVCAIRTDTGTLNTAKAIARATAPINYFLP